MSTNVSADSGTRTVRVSAELSGLSGDLEHLGGPDSRTLKDAGQQPARSALKTALKTAGQAAEAVGRGFAAAHVAAQWVHDRWSREPANQDDHELRRIAYRLERYEDWAPARGLPGLRPANGGFAFVEVEGLTLIHIRLRLDGSLTFGGLVDHADRLLAYLALTRGTVANSATADGHRLDCEAIAVGMLAVHRSRGGSVLMVQAGHRADEAVIWIGQAGELRRVSRQIDAIQAEQAAEQEAAEAAKCAHRDAERAAQRSAGASVSLPLPEPPGAVRGAHGSSVGGAAPKATTVATLIRQALAEGPATGAALAQRIGRSRSEVYRVLGELTARGEVAQDERGGPFRLSSDTWPDSLDN
ncbi:helix-turn-helix domain-containing protein [Streptomyces phaeochromogenes]|uniref:helix-turn-helix domain-containing protein n=1 Tax=Streptomyces phaeochromogenes TaxID=1923 RepID=UPI0033F7FF4F